VRSGGVFADFLRVVGGDREIRSYHARRGMGVTVMELVEERAPVASYCQSVGGAQLMLDADHGE